MGGPQIRTTPTADLSLLEQKIAFEGALDVLYSVLVCINSECQASSIYHTLETVAALTFGSRG